jgi:hypothetical protein
MESEFRRHYGPDGSWARLFRQDPAYIETLLLNDRSTRGRYLTVDRWKTAEAYRSFRERFAEDYAALDRLCEALTGQEADLGSFMELDSEPAA